MGRFLYSRNGTTTGSGKWPKLFNSDLLEDFVFHIGPAGYPEGSKNPLDALQKVKEKGLNAIELQFVRQAKMGKEKARSIGERARELDLLVSAHAPYYINFNSRNEETVEKSIEWVLRTAEIASNAGVWIIVVHAALYHGMSPDDVTGVVMRCIERCLDLMQERSLNPPIIGLETMGKKAAWGRIDEIGEIVRSIDGVVPVVDFAHLHALGGGNLDSLEAVRSCLDSVLSYYDGHLHCHYSSVEFGERGERRHLPIEEGQPPFETIAEALGDWDSDVTIISETPSPLHGASVMQEILNSKSENRI
jgi:deoxyribonuclease-4